MAKSHGCHARASCTLPLVRCTACRSLSLSWHVTAMQSEAHVGFPKLRGKVWIFMVLHKALPCHPGSVALFTDERSTGEGPCILLKGVLRFSRSQATWLAAVSTQLAKRIGAAALVE